MPLQSFTISKLPAGSSTRLPSSSAGIRSAMSATPTTSTVMAWSTGASQSHIGIANSVKPIGNHSRVSAVQPYRAKAKANSNAGSSSHCTSPMLPAMAKSHAAPSTGSAATPSQCGRPPSSLPACASRQTSQPAIAKISQPCE